MKTTKHIFIQIASYRDSQLGATLAHLIDQAANPERLRIGICLQINSEEENTCGLHSFPQDKDLRGAEIALDQIEASLSKGVCWARARTQALWEGEPFTLQIDSHMRFEHEWDTRLIECWQRCRDPRAVISGYPNAFTLPDNRDIEYLSLMAAKNFDDHGILRLQGINTFRNPEQLHQQPPSSAFVAAGMLFGPSSMIPEAPYDPDLYFYGEELSLSLRLWTRGFNFYNPDRLLLFHLYKQSGATHRSHWTDHSDWHILNQRSVEKVNRLLQGQPLEPPFDLGCARSIESWQQWSGVNLGERTISEAALLGRFQPPPPATLSIA